MKIFHVIILASIKYILTLPYAMIIGLEYKQAIIAVLLGGIGGFLFFYYLSKRFFIAVNYAWPMVSKTFPPTFSARHKKYLEERRQKKMKAKRFTRRNRFIVRLRGTYGFWGVIITTPVLLTIPIGAFLASKYYSKRRFVVLYMILSIVAWAGILSGFIHLFPRLFL